MSNCFVSASADLGCEHTPEDPCQEGPRKQIAIRSSPAANNYGALFVCRIRGIGHDGLQPPSGLLLACHVLRQSRTAVQVPRSLQLVGLIRARVTTNSETSGQALVSTSMLLRADEVMD